MLKKFSVVFSLLLIMDFSATLMVENRTGTYFPHALGSFWVYEDQDGNKLTGRTVEEKAIKGETYHTFNYERTLEDWTNYEHYVHPNFYQICQGGIAFLVGTVKLFLMTKSRTLSS